MATELIDVQGKVKYIHAVNHNKYGKWSIVIYPTAASLEVIRDLQAQGVKNVMKKDEEGYFIQFSREPTKLINGKVQAWAKPKVVGSDGQPLDGLTIGKTSDVTLRLEVYEHPIPNSSNKAKAARFDSVRVDNLVKWEIDKDMPPAEAAEVKDLVASPKPVWN